MARRVAKGRCADSCADAPRAEAEVGAWDGLSGRLAIVVGAELLDLSTGRVREDHTCSCRRCEVGRAELAALQAPPLAAATQALIHHAVAFRRALWRAYDLACCRPWTPAMDRLHTAAVLDCSRLVDELGIPAADKVRVLTLKEYGERTQRWPFCAVGNHPMGCGCPDAPREDDDR